MFLCSKSTGSIDNGTLTYLLCSIGGIFLNQELNPCLLHWLVDSLPLSHQGTPNPHLHCLCCFESLCIDTAFLPTHVLPMMDKSTGISPEPQDLILFLAPPLLLRCSDQPAYLDCPLSPPTWLSLSVPQPRLQNYMHISQSLFPLMQNKHTSP